MSSQQPSTYPPCEDYESAACQLFKESFGSLPSRIAASRPSSPQVFNGSQVSSKQESLASSIGKLSLPSMQRLPSPVCENSWDHVMQSFPGQLQQPSTFTKKTLGLSVPALIWELVPSGEIPKRTGNQYGEPHSQGTLLPFRPMCVWSITARYAQLLRIIRFVSPWSEQHMSTGGSQVLENRISPGNKLEWMLTLRIPVPSSGMDTLVKFMSSSMNLEVQSTYHMSFGGWTAIHAEWKSKARAAPLKRKRSGSLPTSIPAPGTPSLTKQHWEPYFDA